MAGVACRQNSSSLADHGQLTSKPAVAQVAAADHGLRPARLRPVSPSKPAAGPSCRHQCEDHRPGRDSRMPAGVENQLQYPQDAGIHRSSAAASCGGDARPGGPGWRAAGCNQAPANSACSLHVDGKTSAAEGPDEVSMLNPAAYPSQLQAALKRSEPAPAIAGIANSYRHDKGHRKSRRAV